MTLTERMKRIEGQFDALLEQVKSAMDAARAAQAAADAADRKAANATGTLVWDGGAADAEAADDDTSTLVRRIRDAARELAERERPGSPTWAMADSIHRAAEREFNRLRD